MDLPTLQKRQQACGNWGLLDIFAALQWVQAPILLLTLISRLTLTLTLNIPYLHPNLTSYWSSKSNLALMNPNPNAAES